MTDAPAIATTDLTKRYGRREVLHGIDLAVRRQEIFGLIGPNGAGKTTLIRILLDLLRPTSGQAVVLGLDSHRDGVALRRRVGYLPGELALYEDLTAAENLRFLARLRRRPDLDPRGLAQRLGLDLHRPVRTLSKGNRQKVGLVQAFAGEPELLVLDEPTGGLDPLVQHEFAAMVEEARARGATVFLSSHVLSEVERVADRVGLVRDGRLATVDDLGRLKARVPRRIDLHLGDAAPPGAFGGLPGVRSVERSGDRVSLVVAGSADPVVKEAARYEVVSIASREPDLEDVFLELYDAAEEVPVAA